VDYTFGLNPWAYNSLISPGVAIKVFTVVLRQALKKTFNASISYFFLNKQLLG
jgi:hypothetical protein